MAAYLTNGGGEYTNDHAPYAPDTQSTRIQTEVKVESCFLILCRQQSQGRYGDGGYSHYWFDEPPSHGEYVGIGVTGIEWPLLSE